MGFIDKIPLLMLAQSQLANTNQSGSIKTFLFGRSPYRDVESLIGSSLDHVEVEASRDEGSNGSATLSSPNYMTNGEYRDGFNRTVHNTFCILLQ